MPRRDKTGPESKGPQTGRGLGPCGDGAPRGDGRGQGFGAQAALRNKKANDSTDQNNK